jgi:predicted TPR repeat methyltransferase
MSPRPPRGRSGRRDAAADIGRMLETAVQAREAGRLADSFAACSRILEREPSNPGALHCLSQIARDRGDADAALDFIAVACRAAPARADLCLERARVHVARGDLADAECALRDAIARGAGIEAQLALVDLLRVERRFEEAHAAAATACTHHGEFAAAHRRLGLVLADLGRGPDAATALARAIDLDPEDPYSFHALGQLWHAAGNVEGALQALRRCVELDPGDITGARSALGQISHSIQSQRPRQPEDGVALRHARRLRCLVERVVSPTRQRLAILELGCGVGSAGTVWRPLARELSAVESDGTGAAIARMSGLYDAVAEALPAVHLAEQPRASLDLIAAPVACTRSHSLSPFFAGAARALRAGGLFALALLADPRGCEITILPGGRFRHSDGYLRRLAQAYGFETVSIARLSDRGRGRDSHAGPTLLALLRNGKEGI